MTKESVLFAYKVNKSLREEALKIAIKVLGFRSQFNEFIPKMTLDNLTSVEISDEDLFFIECNFDELHEPSGLHVHFPAWYLWTEHWDVIERNKIASMEDVKVTLSVEELEALLYAIDEGVQNISDSYVCRVDKIRKKLIGEQEG